MTERYAIFLINLLQDVNILRPLVFMASRDLGLRTRFLVSSKFIVRDSSGHWQNELAEIGRATGTSLFLFDDDREVLQFLQDKSGILLTASESDLSAHSPTNDVFRYSPPGFLKVTLQHGFECIGFRHSIDHDLAHGKTAAFGADVVCAWYDSEKLTSMAPSQRAKLYVTGPTSVLQTHPRDANNARTEMGLVCENMHSVRLNVAGDFKAEFIDIFNEFCQSLAAEDRTVTLRPHPGGQYVLKHNVALPDNVILNNAPMYKVDLAQFAYGISAPSSVVIDMLLAGIPVAIWRDGSQIMDVGNYKGLTEISTLRDWLDFSREAVAHPDRFIELQRRFLDKQRMPTEPEDVYRRFAHLFQTAKSMPLPAVKSATERERILFVANAYIPTLQLSFVKPLAPLEASGEIAMGFLTEQQINDKIGKRQWGTWVDDWVDDMVSRFKPTMLVFCRYSGPYTERLIEWAAREGIPVVYHVDDDLLNIPIEIGREKHKIHNSPERIGSVRYLLEQADLIYCSTENLKERIRSQGFSSRITAGKVYCSSDVLNPAEERPTQTIGYMGFDHAHDLETVLPAVVQFLRKNPTVIFELFGSIPKPKELDEFGPRIVEVPPVRNYAEFLRTFASRRWDIGICPLAPTDFNLVKANTKWVEYTAVGAAVIASRNTVYNDCCDGDCGILAESQEEWLAALEALTHNPHDRFLRVQRAQKKLKEEYSVQRLRTQVLSILSDAKTKNQPCERIMFIANDLVPTLQLSFIKPLAPLVTTRKVALDFITVAQMRERTHVRVKSKMNHGWLREHIESFDPTILIFCRYNGPHADFILEWAQKNNIPSIYHIDDDLLSIPEDLGKEKHAYHNEPERLTAVRYMLDNVSSVYCSTEKLKQRLRDLNIVTPSVAGKVYCSGQVLAPAESRPVKKIGYMASADHAHNLTMILPAIVQFLHRNPSVGFELFGSIPRPQELAEFGDRITVAPPIKNYEAFLSEFATYGWDIGICPLTPIDFNLMKANTKWVEYTSVGAAVVASRGTVYDDCCADGCGILADSTEEWFAALDMLSRRPDQRFAQVQRAQDRLTKEYGIDRLREQIFDIIEGAKALASGPAEEMKLAVNG